MFNYIHKNVSTNHSQEDNTLRGRIGVPKAVGEDSFSDPTASKQPPALLDTADLRQHLLQLD